MNQVVSRIHDLSKSFEDADFLPNILGRRNREATLGQVPVVLFGAGSAGVHLCNALQIHNVHITCFCDNNPGIAGGHRSGRPVISIEELKRKHRDSLIVISTSHAHAQSIFDQLLDLGFEPDHIHIPPWDHLLYYTNLLNQYWSNADLDTHARQLQEACDLLSDEKSKELFVHRVALAAGGFDYGSYRHFIRTFADLISNCPADLFSTPRYDENFFYFNSDFLPLKDHEVFANVGALIGDCALEFMNTCREKGLQYKEIINFEPDPNNFALLSAKMGNLPDVKCLPYGLWSSRSRLRFANPDQSGTGAPGSLNKEGDLEVEVVSLDEILPGSEISFIKMDVEGAEIEALSGAAETIGRNAPKLAISLYHKRNDIFEIPLLVNQLHPAYKFYLRHHSTTFGETVLYAAPR